MNELIINRLSKTYHGGIKALDGVSLSLSNGMFGLLGPNGAGKSSLMRTLAALQWPDEGQLTFNGQDILNQPQYVRSRLGYLPQEFGVYPRLSAWRLLDHLAVLKGLYDKKKRRTQIESLLQQTNLTAYRNKSVHTFSGGMRQRFGVAQALLGDPQLILVDEPTAGLDPEERQRFHNLLSEIGEDRIVLLSTHIVEDVRDLCGRMAIMHEGKIILQGIPAEWIGQLKGHIWQKQLSKDHQVQDEVQQKMLSSRLFGGQRLIRVFAEKPPTEGFQAVDPKLEDVYFAALSSKI